MTDSWMQDPALGLALAAVALLAASGVPGLFGSWRARWGPRLASALVVAGALVGLAGAVLTLRAPGPVMLEIPSPLVGVRGVVGVDALSAFFAVPIYLLGALGSLYGLRYWPPAEHPRHGRRLRFAYGVLVASMAALTLARDGITFLVAWEVFALSTFFAVTTAEEQPKVRRAGWIYLLYAHVSLLCLVAAVLLFAAARGDFLLAPLAAASLSPRRLAILAALVLVGFGVKAGLLPLHSWLPEAHAAAPSHVSALMSGVAIKMGVYGLVRFGGLLPALPLGWGGAVLALGAVSAVVGVVYALAQHDLKRLLAFHSIENVGIIVMGLGVALLGRTAGRWDWVALGLGGCLLHVWNHALFKSLLFFGAGSVDHAVGTRDLERMGGLAKRLPVTAATFLVGALAICGLPPLNGFVSELLVYLGLFRAVLSDGPVGLGAALAVVALAAVGALAVACFVKVYGVVFLGTARTAAAERAHESSRFMVGPMIVLATACALIGLLPGAVRPLLERALAVWVPASEPAAVALGELVPWPQLSAWAAALLVFVALLGATVAGAARRARRRAPDLPTWDCGYAVASPRLQYTASSFAALVTARFAWLLRPQTSRPRLAGPFPAPAHFHSTVDDALLVEGLEPLARRALALGTELRAHPQGQLQRYLLYVVAAVVALLLWSFL